MREETDVLCDEHHPSGFFWWEIPTTVCRAAIRFMRRVLAGACCVGFRFADPDAHACLALSLVAPHPAIQPLPESNRNPLPPSPVRCYPPALPRGCAASSSDHTPAPSERQRPLPPLPAWKKQSRSHSRNTREVPSAGETRNSLQRSQHFPGCRIHFESIGPFVSATLAPFLLSFLAFYPTFNSNSTFVLPRAPVCPTKKNPTKPSLSRSHRALQLGCTWIVSAPAWRRPQRLEGGDLAEAAAAGEARTQAFPVVARSPALQLELHSTPQRTLKAQLGHRHCKRLRNKTSETETRRKRPANDAAVGGRGSFSAARSAYHCWLGHRSLTPRRPATLTPTRRIPRSPTPAEVALSRRHASLASLTDSLPASSRCVFAAHWLHWSRARAGQLIRFSQRHSARRSSNCSPLTCCSRRRDARPVVLILRDLEWVCDLSIASSASPDLQALLDKSRARPLPHRTPRRQPPQGHIGTSSPPHPRPPAAAAIARLDVCGVDFSHRGTSDVEEKKERRR
ncbi:hypothetical protein QBC34DRAFT_209785 [Podospora aff. communis PSN243]|uniref:Uncharacterized protein n=1 Tax=Podospora aff. communis PSN243 TaxID=3040156 RepID=A0AAV9GZ90_9PEZI|nr:hypothetical protein QBC34DRAFT_209785 [Podospora aff. communis PSN243]